MAARKKPSTPRKKAPAPRRKPAAQAKPETVTAPADSAAREAEEHFRRGLLTRGEAARPVDGQLPPGATHEIVEEKAGEPPKIVRKRFSLF